VIVLGQVEAAGAAGEAAALGDALEKFVLADALADGALQVAQALDGGVDLGEETLQGLAADARFVADALQGGGLTVEFLDELGLDVGAGADGGDIQQGLDQGPRGPGVVLGLEKGQLFEQVFEPHLGAGAFVERMFEG
jgi:hypothetical protein